MKIWAHMIVRNEERFVWYSVMSVIEYVDKILVWDTGSDDKTVEIIREIEKRYPKKVSFKQVGKVDPESFTAARQRMLEKTSSDWILILDGDEVWWEGSIKKVVNLIKTKGKELDSIVNRYYNLVGDIYHYLEENAGKYNIDGRRGHLTIRAMNMNIPGLSAQKPHGIQGYYDKNGKLIQQRPKTERYFVSARAFLHFTHLLRSKDRLLDKEVPKRKKKLKYALGSSFPLDFYYPEVFFKPRPNFIPSPWVATDKQFRVRSYVLSSARIVKRRLVQSPVGY